MSTSCKYCVCSVEMGAAGEWQVDTAAAEKLLIGWKETTQSLNCYFLRVIKYQNYK